MKSIIRGILRVLFGVLLWAAAAIFLPLAFLLMSGILLMVSPVAACRWAFDDKDRGFFYWLQRVLDGPHNDYRSYEPSFETPMEALKAAGSNIWATLKLPFEPMDSKNSDDCC